MFKVAIIDDEPVIIKGLKSVMDWAKYDCEVCACASDGIEGENIIEQFHPDIIITDIRMPGSDGLAMIDKVKNIVPWAKIIFLTGYRDFDYAKEAIKLGAFDFLLKPCDLGELTSAIERAAEELKMQQNNIEQNEKLKKLFEQNIPLLKEKLLYDIIWGISTDKDEIKAKLDLFDIHIGYFALILADNDRCCISEERTNGYLYQFGVINLFKEAFAGVFDITDISLDMSKVGFIIHLADKPCDDALSDIYDKCGYIQKLVQDCFGFTISLAVSSPGHGAFDLPLKLRECLNAIKYKCYLGENSIILYKDLHAIFDYKDISALERYRSDLMESIRIGNIQMVDSNIRAFQDYVNDIKDIDKDYLSHFIHQIINNILEIYEPVLKDNKNEICIAADDIDGAFEVLLTAAVKAAGAINEHNNRNISDVLKRAVEYIRENYAKPITLEDVARHTFVSSYYLSRLFKKELNKNFIDYVNELRMERARQLLKQGNHKSYEIAEMVGISDPHYFSKMFKKYFGVTPTEFKEMM